MVYVSELCADHRGEPLRPELQLLAWAEVLAQERGTATALFREVHFTSFSVIALLPPGKDLRAFFQGLRETGHRASGRSAA